MPQPYLERPNRDISVPSSVETVGRGKHIYIPVEVNGTTRDYVFDTGCSFGNFVSEKYAEEVGLEIVADSFFRRKRLMEKQICFCHQTRLM